MAGPALGIDYLLLILFFGFLLGLLYYTIKERRSPKKAIPVGLLFLVLLMTTFYIYYKMNRSELDVSKKFLGDYKLENLDRKKCDDCKVRLKSGYTYDIIVSNKIVGHGKWHIETAIDIPGYFLKVENGPIYVVWESDRLIEYIDRTNNN